MGFFYDVANQSSPNGISQADHAQREVEESKRRRDADISVKDLEILEWRKKSEDMALEFSHLLKVSF